MTFCLVIATRKAFVVTSMYKSLIAHRKCTVAAEGNLSVQILYSIGNIWRNFCDAISHLYIGQLKRIEALFILLFSGVTVICVSPGIVFPAHISLGMRVSPHTYH